MLSKKQRLTKKEIQGLQGPGLRAQGSHITLKKFDLPQESGCKVSVSVPKKILKKAHDRNKVRRRVFGVLRELKSSLPTPSALMFQVQNDIEDLSYSELRQEIVGLLGGIK